MSLLLVGINPSFSVQVRQHSVLKEWWIFFSKTQSCLLLSSPASNEIVYGDIL